jgi:DSF synthase
MPDTKINNDFFSIFRDFNEVSGRYDPDYRAVWCYHNPNPRPVFSTNMLTELITMQQRIMDYFDGLDPDEEPMIHYLILLSKVPGIFSMGGDLKLFSKLIKEKDRQQLLDYGLKCIKVLYLNSVNMHLPVTTISLIEGQAFGGGFECALSSNIVIATRNSEMGFPEIKFNLFPGMGAYQFIARSCGTLVADKMLSTGDSYSAEELYEMGVVHRLCEEGHGIECVEEFMTLHKKKAKVHQALQNVKSRIHPIKYEELESVVELWTKTALGLEDKDLKFIDRVVKSQEIKMSAELSKARTRTRHDRRFSDRSTQFPLTDSFGEKIKADRRKSPERRS